MFHYVVGLISGIRGFSREPRGRSGRFATGPGTAYQMRSGRERFAVCMLLRNP
jgi:hypothetical protein